jgi:hypothetical protein
MSVSRTRKSLCAFAPLRETLLVVAAIRVGYLNDQNKKLKGD